MLQALVPGVSPENQLHLGSKSTPCEAGGVGSWLVPEPWSRRGWWNHLRDAIKGKGEALTLLQP